MDEHMRVAVTRLGDEMPADEERALLAFCDEALSEGRTFATQGELLRAWFEHMGDNAATARAKAAAVLAEGPPNLRDKLD